MERDVVVGFTHPYHLEIVKGAGGPLDPTLLDSRVGLLLDTLHSRLAARPFERRKAGRSSRPGQCRTRSLRWPVSTASDSGKWVGADMERSAR